MRKLTAVVIMLFTSCLIAFATWQLYRGNLEAAFMPLPFLLIIYFYLRPGEK